MQTSLQKQGINANYINLIKDIYTGCSTTVKLHKESDHICIRKGVNQGDTISPKLFTACLEKIFRDINWGNKGININGKNLNHVRFADDVVVIASNLSNIQDMIQDLDTASKKEK